MNRKLNNLIFAVILTIICLVTVPSYATPLVLGHNYSATSSSYQATQTAFEVLQNGGTAADAAFALAATIGVTEAWFSGVLSGGTWALYYEKATDKVYALDGVSWTGSHANAEFFRDPDVPSYGMHWANVPGAWDGWMKWLDRFGTKDLGELMARAIDLAENGHPANSATVGSIGRQQDDILRMPDTKAVFMPNGVVPKLGEMIYQKNLAKTFRSLVDVWNENLPKGRSAAFQAANDYYYRGPIAEKIVAFSKENGGHFELSDFNESNVVGIVEPISIDYKGITVYECPPNSQGITTLMALNILKGYDFSQYKLDDPDVIHLIIESLKLAQSAKYHYVATPDFYDNPVKELLSDEFADKQRARISMDSALVWPIEGGLGDYETPRIYKDARGNTTTYSVVDQYGNVAAVTTSLGYNLLVVGDTGICINNRVTMFEIEEGNPNMVEPRKKVRHTSNPYIAMKDGKVIIAGGNTGADFQPQGQVEQFIRVVEFGIDPELAVSLPRFETTAFPNVSHPHLVRNTLNIERGFPEETYKALEAKGHKVNVGGGTFGSAQMTVIDPETGVIKVGADPRNPGLGLAW